MSRRIFMSLLVTSLFSHALLAHEPFDRYGTVIPEENGAKVKVEGGMTITAQHSSDSHIDNELLASFDLVSLIPYRAGEWSVYVEGNASPRSEGVASIFGEANADAGSALDRDGKGRLQVSEFHYSHLLYSNRLTIGLLDPASVLDSSDVANDETAQFIGASFVNNPTIAFPDYTLGASYHVAAANHWPGVNLLLTGSHGLADNPNASYAELVDVSAEGKGVFLGSELYWELAQSTWRIGAWLSSADHDTLDRSGNTDNNQGVYLNMDYSIGEHKLNIRAGLANEAVSEAAGFLGLALQTALAGNTVGFGVAQTGVSSKSGSGTDDVLQAEIYARFDINQQFHITPSLQWIENSGFDSSETNYDNRVSIISVRTNYGF